MLLVIMLPQKTILTNFIYPLKLPPSQPATSPPPPNPLSLLQAQVTLKSVWRKVSQKSAKWRDYSKCALEM